jgi:hypothetical protein
MPKYVSRRNWQFSPLALTGIICIALVLMMGMVQVVHSHSSGQPEHDCALCISAHQVIQIVVLVTLFVSSVSVVRLVSEPTSLLPAAAFFFQLASRPPPAAPAFA